MANTLIRPVLLLVVTILASQVTPRVCEAQDRPRLIVLTDFYKDPDDKQSMIRLLTCANEFEIEGVIATSLAYGDGAVHPEWILAQIDDYAAVYENLSTHGRDGNTFPSPEELRQVVRSGAPVKRKFVGRNRGFAVPFPLATRDTRACEPADQWIGPDRDTPASQHIIRVVDRDDCRPVWVTIWGGAMDLAQALWRIRNDRTREEVRKFVSRLRVYQISWQDTGVVWIWNNFPQLFLIHNRQALRGIYAEGAPEMRSTQWVNEHIRQDHGVLGAGYPEANIKGIKEGDTPSFLHLLARGLSRPERPEWGGWGGRFERLDDEHRFYVDAADVHPSSQEPDRQMRWAVGRWNSASSNDLAARMDWCVLDYQDANHHPITVVDGNTTRDILYREVVAGQWIQLDATGSRDPDNDTLNYRWWQYVEAGSPDCMVSIANVNSAIASFQAPDVVEPRSVHVVLSVSDEGQPPLTSYRRVIVSIKASAMN
ncbi:MAG: DUF1593 domain-containing protein [Fuerstiella sp.]|nr:DUF1593 domain-containing protein [Fuerstiella sp.]MCP4858426.1 DUF1593 domain-containing protein [Fuerstiella sp.]